MAGNVGRPRKPTALKIVGGHAKSGSATECPAKFEAGQPPEHLNEDARLEWARIAPILEKRGLISLEESTALALYCQAFGRWQMAEKKIAELAIDGQDGLIVKAPSGYPIQNPYLAIANKAMEQCYQFLQQFGLSPATRSRVSGSSQLELFINGGEATGKRYFS